RPPLMGVSHNIDYDLASQYVCAGSSLVRRLYAKANWRKLQREELGPTATPTGFTCAARWTSGACSTRSLGPAQRSFPTRRTSSTTSRAQRTRRPTAAPWSTSASSLTPLQPDEAETRGHLPGQDDQGSDPSRPPGGSQQCNSIVSPSHRAALWRQWKTPRRRRAALVANGVSTRAARNTAGSGRGPWYLARTRALSTGLSNAHFKSLGLPSLLQAC